MRPGERGVALLEAVVALTLLLACGVAMVSLLAAALRNEALLIGREATLREADRVLAALTLLTRNDLDRRLGRHQAGRFMAEVRRPEPTLYRIALSDADPAETELLVTVVYRTEPARP